MRSRQLGLTALLLAVALICFPSRPAAGGQTPTVAVLYFDNNTGQKKLDMLQKGFADMVITDLAGLDNIHVVEREKLQSLLAELKLQRGKYFDPATAVKIGKGLGATHTLAGSFVAVSPRMRIDVRLIDNSTGKIVVASKVSGEASNVFELEQQLIHKFIKGLKITFDPPLRPQTRVEDLDVLLTYSKGIDLADKENFQEASVVMALAVKRAPMFALARVRSGQILARLNQARSRRDKELMDSGVVLARNVDKALRQKPATLSQTDAAQYMAYRYVRGHVILRTLRKHLSDASPSVILLGHQKKVEKLLQAYYANTQLFLREFDQYMGLHGKTSSWHRFELPDDDVLRARHSELWVSVPTDRARVVRDLAQFMLTGRAQDGGRASYTIAPTPANLIPRFKREGFAILEDNWRSAWAIYKKDPSRDQGAISALDAQADALLLHGQREKAIAKWQEILDRFPTSTSFKSYETRIKKQLGIVYDNNISKLDRYQKGLKSCVDMDFRVGLPAIVYRRTRLQGLVAGHATITEIEKACRGNAKASRFWPYLYSHMALYFARHGDCASFDKYMARSVAEGGSQSDARGYRKNYTKCPAP